MKKINLLSLAVIFILAISGCVTGSKTVEPSTRADNSAPPIAVPRKPLKSYSWKSAKIQYSQITNLISEFIDIKETSLVPGENSYSGISENKLTIFEIRGPKDDVKEASMKLIYPKGIDKASAELNNAMMSRFLKNIAPELPDWDNRIKEILNKFHSIAPGAQGVAREDIKINNFKIIQILYDKNTSYITVTLKPRP